MTAVEVSAACAERLKVLEAASQRSTDQVVAEALELLWVHWVADDPDPSSPAGYPFHKRYPSPPQASPHAASALLRQETQTDFIIAEPFDYTGPVQPKGPPRTWTIGYDGKEKTDLASIPSFLTWLIPRYGRHTLAAIVHDHLQRHLMGPPSAAADEGQVSSAEADFVLRNAMTASGVPFLRRWLIWAGVTLRTLFTKDPRAYYLVVVGLSLVAFVLAGLVGWVSVITAVVAWGEGHAFSFPPLWFWVGAAVLPLPVCVLWRSWWRAGLIGGYAVMFVALPTLLVLMATGVYVAAEWVFKARGHEEIHVDESGPIRTPRVNPIFPSNWKERMTASGS